MTETLDWGGGVVSIAWHHPAAEADAYVALTHGAGGNMHTPQLRAFAEALAAAGIGAVRFNLQYAEDGKRSPGPQARSEACWRGVAAQLSERLAERAPRWFLGGRSYGGRIASHVVAAGTPAAGLIFLAYPLHAPGKTEALRDAHLRDIAAPMLFLQGTRDTFARWDLLEATATSLPSATLHAIEGGDHSHKVSGRPAADVNAEMARVAVEWIRAR